MKKFIIVLAALASVGVAQGAIVSNSEAASFTVANDDLLQTALASVNASALNDRSSGTDTAFLEALAAQGVTVGEPSLHDGAWYDHDFTADWGGDANLTATTTESRGSALAEDNEFAEYSLDLVASPQGYNIDTIDLYSNWGSLGGRDEIKVTITASLVATPDVFDQVIVTDATYNPAVETQAKMNISDINLSGIAGIRFLWPDGQENSAVGYSELDVIGSAIGGGVQPVIDIAQIGNDVIVSWTNAGFKLQSSPDLTDTNAWMDFPTEATNSVTVSATNSVEFFRLIQQ